ncbi:Uncharacterised protein [Neisseria zoodegmatis]|uniref:Uncharacterized protein n=1 Tax=Neisseria zoodegmatis TaxID=326523 RepID=A0A378WER6_9NEIS|nr:Uncharacterised protein [Neisseria zoodegmatis]
MAFNAIREGGDVTLKNMNVKGYCRLCVWLPAIMLAAACAHSEKGTVQAKPTTKEQVAAVAESHFNKPHEQVELQSSRSKKSSGMKKMSNQADHVTAEGVVKSGDNPPAPVIDTDKAKVAAKEFKAQAAAHPPYKDLDMLTEEEHRKILKKSLPMIGQYGNVDSTGLGHYPRRDGERYQSDRPIIYYVDE